MENKPCLNAAPSLPEGPSVRASVKESYNKVISDAKESISYLPDVPLHPMRPSKPAAYGLLARTYLTIRQYDSASKYANLYLLSNNQLINFNGDADIIRSFAGLSSPFKQFNKETIFYTEEGIDLSNLTSPIFASIDTILYSSYANNDWRKDSIFCKL